MTFLASEKAPAAIGPYSQGVEAKGTIYVSGQLPVKDGVLLSDPGEAAAAALENVLHVVAAGGGSKESIVKCLVFARDMAHFGAINAAYAAFFGDHKPARSFIQVSGLPRDAVLEIECVAVV